MSEHERATLAGGCFWCVEAAFEELAGVTSVTSGYAGGHVANPTYEEVCSETTGHAEVVQVEYDPEEIGYADLLRVFFTIHDPTTLNRQGPDVGESYRSAIFYQDDAQREIAEEFVAELEAEGAYDDPIVTEIEPLEAFYEAEEYHQDYYAKNPGDGYCQFNADPKIAKVREKFADEVTHEARTTDD
ncbi:peptide-methionine (S)-S-oxide reductase MsrA [Halorarum salinum]|uniref:Peptide methionine sulfoxide reductase MsrA n=1 Tax=Halorarum salinum TaxID=2743089 RepID=A0A7D5LBZ0_9EURY|nr:peptide-methionine (S)-S-oxide reductase MsrA [Halobaculum salinum]QLG62455.1 peptide-methionine (S)-S-oxide reductase MsrA [Halobaculum salinum]